MKRFYLLFGLVLLASAVQAQSITTIQLQNRPAVEVIPVVEPMLGANDAISGHGFKIFLRAPAQTVAQVREMIESLDAPLKMLQISVFQGSTRGLEELGLSAGVRIEGGDGSISIGNGGGSNAGGSITYGTDRGNANASGISTRKRLQDNPIHQIRVAEGNEAYIETGAQIPYFSGAGWIPPGRVAGGIEYKDVVTGFYVLPRVSGERVTLQVSPFKNTQKGIGGGKIATQSANTTVSGRLGDWLLIGGVTEELRRAQSGSGTYRSTQARNNESIWIKADLVR